MAQAGQTVLSGGVALRQDYDSNIDRTSQNQRSEWLTAVSPTLRLTAKGPDNALVFRYAPSLVYSHRTDLERIDHLLAARVEKEWGERFSTYLSDTFVRAEDPSADDEAATGLALADNRGRNRYLTNNFDVGMQYVYARESFFKLSYQNRILDNDGGDREDFRKNTPGISVFHRFSPQWQAQVDTTFTDGNFDQTDDLTQNTGDFFLYYSQTPTSKLFGHYGVAQTAYDGLQDDYSRQNISLGWIRQQSATLDFKLEGGSVFLNRDNRAAESELYYAMSVNQKTERGEMNLAAAGGVDEQQFNGATDEGVSRYWSLNAAIRQELYKNIHAAAKCSYRTDTYIDQLVEQEKRKLQAEASLSHTFGQWYMVSVKYIYARQGADISTDRYEDNRLLMVFSFNKDFVKW